MSKATETDLILEAVDNDVPDLLDKLDAVSASLYGVAPTARQELQDITQELRVALRISDGWEGNEALADEHRAGLHGVIQQDCPLCPAKD